MKPIQMSSFLALGAAFLAGGLIFTGPARAQEKKVTIVSWGGSFQDAEREHVWKPYAKETGVKVLDDTWNGDFGIVKAQVESKNVTWDIIIADFEHALAGCELSLLVELPASILGDKNDYYPGMTHKCGVGKDVFSAIMAYDGGRIPASWSGKLPTTIQDAFDVKTFPGKRGIRKRVKNFFEQILMSDGVPPEKLYEEVDKRKGFDRFMAKVESIKKDLLFFDRNEQAIQLLGNGEVQFASTFNGRPYAANEKDGKKFVIIWDGQIQALNTIVIPKGPRQEEGLKLAAYILKPEVMARYANAYPYGPSRKSALAFVDAKMVPNLATAPVNMKKALVRSEEWWADHLQEVQEKFNAWLSKL